MINLLRVANGDAPGGADYTYTATNDALYSLLEAWLSVIVACLTVLQPVFTKMFFTSRSILNRWSIKSSQGAPNESNPSSTQGRNIDRARFQRLDDAYELSEGLAWNQDASATAARVPDDSAGPAGSFPPADGTITVKRDLHVHAVPRAGA